MSSLSNSGDEVPNSQVRINSATPTLYDPSPRSTLVEPPSRSISTGSGLSPSSATSDEPKTPVSGQRTPHEAGQPEQGALTLQQPHPLPTGTSQPGRGQVVHLPPATQPQMMHKPHEVRQGHLAVPRPAIARRQRGGSSTSRTAPLMDPGRPGDGERSIVQSQEDVLAGIGLDDPSREVAPSQPRKRGFDEMDRDDLDGESWDGLEAELEEMTEQQEQDSVEGEGFGPSREPVSKRPRLQDGEIQHGGTAMAGQRRVPSDEQTVDNFSTPTNARSVIRDDGTDAGNSLECEESDSVECGRDITMVKHTPPT